VSLKSPIFSKKLSFLTSSVSPLTFFKIFISTGDKLDRMPPQIGDFISETVYDNKLMSNPLHPITGSVMACYFIDVKQGREERSGTSWLVSYLMINQ
jgi:hypothetical protein